MKLPIIPALGISLAILAYTAFKLLTPPTTPGKFQTDSHSSSIPFTAQNEDFYSQVQQKAKDSSSVDIANCVSNPRIIRVQNHSRLLIKNTGPIGHYISVHERYYFLGTKKSVEVTINAATTPLMYPLACDVPGPLAGGGIILVTN